MKTNHFLEAALVTAIEQKETDTAINLIDLILKTVGTSLARCDDLGEGFLSLALKLQEEKVAAILFDKLQKVEIILFGKHPNGQNLLHIATDAGNLQIVKELITLSEQQSSKESPGYKLWTQTDSRGKTPLHYAAADRNRNTILACFLATILKHADNFLINLADENKDSALHFACKAGAINNIVMLISGNADLLTLNSIGKTPFSFLLIPSESTQSSRGELEEFLGNDKNISQQYFTLIEVFSKLENQKKHFILDLVRKDLLTDIYQDKSDFKTLYFTLAGMTSLTALCIAKHEFDESLPLRTTYTQIQTIFEDEETKKKPVITDTGEFAITVNELFITEEIFARMPLYLKKVENYLKDNSTHQINLRTQQIEQDLEKIKTLLKDVEIYINKLRARPKLAFSTSDKKLILIVCVIVMILAIIGSLLIGWDQYRISHDPNCSFVIKPHSCDISIFTSLGIVPLVFAGATLLMPLLNGPPSRNPTTAFVNEWQKILTSINEILAKLQDLEKLDKDNGLVNFLPTNPQIVRDIEKISSKLTSDQSTVEAIKLFEELQKLLTTVQSSISLTRRPLTLIMPNSDEVVVPIKLGKEEEDEPIPQKSFASKALANKKQYILQFFTRSTNNATNTQKKETTDDSDLPIIESDERQSLLTPTPRLHCTIV